ncbi:hypothetical protein, partial [Ferrimonas marina]
MNISRKLICLSAALFVSANAHASLPWVDVEQSNANISEHYISSQQINTDIQIQETEQFENNIPWLTPSTGDTATV